MKRIYNEKKITFKILMLIIVVLFIFIFINLHINIKLVFIHKKNNCVADLLKYIYIFNYFFNSYFFNYILFKKKYC